jgi:2-phospho-L-lactate guanylyltransferase
MSMPWVIVPVKALGEAKQRLAAVLPPEARRRLMLAMLRDVLATLAQVQRLGPVLVVTPDAQAAEVALDCGVRVLRERCPQGHSAAASAGFAHARAHGAGAAITLPADAPCVTPEEVARLLAAADGGPGRRVVLVPSRDGDGTNAVLAMPPEVFPPLFGPGSFARHRAAAEARELDCRVLELPGLGMDVDEPRDLRDLMARKRGDSGYAFLWEDAGAFHEVARGAIQP